MPAQPWNEEYEHPQVTRFTGSKMDMMAVRGVLMEVAVR